MADVLQENLKKIVKEGEEVIWSGHPVAEAKALFKKDPIDGTLYVITNKRVITVRKNFNKYNVVNLSTIHNVQFFTDEDGNVSFVVGKKFSNPTKKSVIKGSLSNYPWMDALHTDCEGFVMYALPDKGEIFQETLKQYVNF